MGMFFFQSQVGGGNLCTKIFLRDITEKWSSVSAVPGCWPGAGPARRCTAPTGWRPPARDGSANPAAPQPAEREQSEVETYKGGEENWGIDF